MRYDFDKITDRRNTLSLKWDCAARRGMPEGLLPMWVADMDFPAPPAVLDALKRVVGHGVFGYSEPRGDYFDAAADYFNSRYGFKPRREWHITLPGVVYGVGLAIKAFTREGDGVLIQPPVYYPFKGLILSNNRRPVNNPLTYENGAYAIDLNDFERKIKNERVKLFILCNPHNPTGRVFTLKELSAMGAICRKYGVITVSDEIHADFVYPGFKHTCFYGADDAFQEFSVVLNSPSKSFNLAGLQAADAFIADEKLRAPFLKEREKSGYSQQNVFGITGAYAAYKHGAEWFARLLAYLEGNRGFIADFTQKNMPQVKFVKPEGTYLAWLDFTALRLAQAQLDGLMIKKAKLWLDGGTMFGQEGEGFERLNFACPRSVLKDALTRIAESVNG